MTSNDLKIFSMFYIAEHDNLSKPQKMDLYEFVKKADTFSVMNFLVTGQPIYVPTRHRQAVVESFIDTKVGYILTEGPLDTAVKHGKDAWDTVKHGAEHATGAVKDAAHGVVDYAHKLGGEGAAGHAARTVKDAASDVGDAVSRGAGAVTGAAKDAAHGVVDAAHKLGGEGQVGHAVRHGKEMASDAGEAIGKAAHQVGDTATKAAGAVGDFYKGGIETIANRLADTDTFGQHGLFGHGQKVQDIIKNLNQGATGIAATAAAAAIGYLGYKVYKNYFSGAAKACKAAPDKKACMTKVRLGAITQAAKTLNSQKGTCKKSTDPAKCAAKIDAKLAKMRTKASSLK